MNAPRVIADLRELAARNIRFRDGGTKDMRSPRLVTAHQPFLEHDLKQLEHGGVAHPIAALELRLDLIDRRGPTPPEHAQDLEFGGCRFGMARHGSGDYYEALRKRGLDDMASPETARLAAAS